MRISGSKNILLVEPNFPVSSKSKNHSSFLPIGLLKLASFYRKKGFNIQLIRGNRVAKFYPNKILVTSLFTYWSIFVKETVAYYRTLYPKAIIEVGGIYATLMPEHCKKFTGCDNVFIGQHKQAEKLRPAYDLVDVDYQIIHGMRGCPRKCKFCGIWKIESFGYKKSNEIRKEICSNKIIFYDNNILANPDIDNILLMLSKTTYRNKVIKSECQSGFDGRILIKKPHLSKLLKKARFENIRLAWDFSYSQFPEVKRWISLLNNVGYNNKNIFIFMIYNWNIPCDELEAKRKKCFKWGVQISDCRFRPIDQTYDNYKSNCKNQTENDYYIHPNWTDKKIKNFRANVRKHNICIRYNIKWSDYDKQFEREYSRKSKIKFSKLAV